MEKPADILRDEQYSVHVGVVHASGTPLSSQGRLSLVDARKRCDSLRGCAAFSVQVPEPHPLPAGVFPVKFFSAAPSVDADVGWVTYRKEGAAASSSGTSHADGGATNESASQRRAEMLARYYIATAELMAAGSKHQAVVEQLRAALLSGADRDTCYVMRAHAYLALGNVDSCKRDLGAILRSDPEHAEAKALHRKLKRFSKALEEGAALEGTRQWAAAAARYTAAADAFAAPPPVLGLSLGLCRCETHLRKGKEASRWCGLAHASDPSSLDYLFLYAEALVLDEQEHRALQLLKAAQRKQPRNGQLHAKIDSLERAIKRKSKVDYYKALGVPRTATPKQIKRKYHEMARRWHPDKNPGDKDKAELMFKKIARANEVLSDPELRARYDRGEDVDAPNAQQQRGGGNPFGGFGGGGFNGDPLFYRQQQPQGGGRRQQHFYQGGFRNF
jgi:DnaJ family protein C protein 3